jgi:hypothetical protein
MDAHTDDNLKAEVVVHEEDVRTKKITRKVLWKLDTRVLPVLALLFLCK